MDLFILQIMDPMVFGSVAANGRSTRDHVGSKYLHATTPNISENW